MDTLNINLTKYRESFHIGSFDTDLKGKIKLTSICNYLQEIAGKHVDLIHQGIDDLKANNMAWVLSRLKVQIFESPNWKDKIDIETWSVGTDGLFGNREFRIYNADSKIIGQATSSWLVINTKTKRPVRPQQIVEKMPVNPEGSIFEQALQKIKFDNEFDLNEEIHIHYSDIDINQHVNNVKYIKWVIDSCPIEIITNHQIEELEVNFLHEAMLGQVLELFTTTKNKFSQMVIKNKDTGIENCRAIINWK